MAAIPISIDLSELQAEFNLKITQVDELGSTLVNTITDRLFHNWKSLAMNGLHSTRKVYCDALQKGELSPTRHFIQLTGTLPNQIEEGYSAFDMKPGMLNSPKAKVTSKGVKFITIPFRWATAGSIGESEVFSNVMPREIDDIVTSMRPTITAINSNRVISRGESLGFGQIPAQYQIPKTRAAFSDVKSRTTYPEYTHQGPISEGITRNQKTYENATQSNYVTFRRVSEKSSPMSWIHKGVAAKNFAQQAIQETDVDNIVDRTIDAFLQKINS